MSPVIADTIRPNTALRKTSIEESSLQVPVTPKNKVAPALCISPSAGWPSAGAMFAALLPSEWASL
jgi:hypothetical protein